MYAIDLLLQAAITLFIIGLGLSLIVGRGPMASKYTAWSAKTAWRLTRWFLKSLCGLVANLFKWAHSKL